MNVPLSETTQSRRRSVRLGLGLLAATAVVAACATGCGNVPSKFNGSRITYRVDGREEYREEIDAPLEQTDGLYEVVGDRATLGLGSLEPGKCMTKNALLEVTDGVRQDERTYSSHNGHCESTTVEVCVEKRRYDLVWGHFSASLCPVYSGQFDPQTVEATGEFVAAWK